MTCCKVTRPHGSHKYGLINQCDPNDPKIQSGIHSTSSSLEKTYTVSGHGVLIIGVV